MEKSESYLIHSKDFESKIKSSWQVFLDEKDYCDVTLACDDKLIEAHKIILSSSSPVLQNIFKYSKHNSTVFFKGIKFSDLRNILNFIYQGEVNIANEEVESFLGAAEELKIQGLSVSVNIGSKPTFSFPQIKTNQIDEPNKKRQKLEETKLIDYSDGVFKNKVSNVSNQQYTYNETDTKGVSEESVTDIVSVGKSVEKEEDIAKSNSIKYCNIDSLDPIVKIEEYANVISDVEDTSKSISILDENSDIRKKEFLKCRYCEKYFKYKYNIRRHEEAAHKGIEHFCDQCTYKSSDKSTINNHVRTVHDGFRYSCDECDYTALNSSQVKMHTDTTHKGVRYACDQCNSELRSKGSLKQHIDTVHNGVRYSCTVCDHKSTTSSDLNKHVKKRHQTSNILDDGQYTYDTADSDGFLVKSITYLTSTDDNIQKEEHILENDSESCTNISSVVGDVEIKENIISDIENKNEVFPLLEVSTEIPKKDFFRCGYCEKIFNNKYNMFRHEQTTHQGIKFHCDICDYKASEKGLVNNHVRTIHEGFRYSCDECGYTALHRNLVKQHTESIHKGVRYACHKCNSELRSKGSLKQHLDMVHNGIRYPCTDCDYKASKGSDLNKHIKKKHQIYQSV